ERRRSMNNDRARGALLGLAIGDAMGAPTEGMTLSAIRDRWGRVRGFVDPDAAGTDDTEYAVLCARGVLRAGAALTSRHVADTWLEALRAQRSGFNRAGFSEMIAIANLHAGMEPPASGQRNAETWSDGAAMRVAPIGVLAAGDPALAARGLVVRAHRTPRPRDRRPCGDSAGRGGGALRHHPAAALHVGRRRPRGRRADHRPAPGHRRHARRYRVRRQHRPRLGHHRRDGRRRGGRPARRRGVRRRARRPGAVRDRPVHPGHGRHRPRRAGRRARRARRRRPRHHGSLRMTDRLDRAVGAVHGLALGDALGAPAGEHRPVRDPWVRQLLRKGPLELDESRVLRPVVPFVLSAVGAPALVATDDAESFAVAARVLLEAPGRDTDSLFDTWRALLDTPDTWTSAAQRSALINAASGLRPPHTGADNPAFYDDSALSGALAVAVATSTPDDAAALARALAVVTHDGTGVHAAAAYARVLAHLLDGAPLRPALESGAAEVVADGWLADGLRDGLRLAGAATSPFAAPPAPVA